MTELVKVSSIETNQGLTASIENLFNNCRYTEITQAIGMHSILVDPQHTQADQNRLYRTVLNLLKNKIQAVLGERFSAWYVAFPMLMDKLISSGTAITKPSAAVVLASHREAFGAFTSVEDFFSWALDDRRLELGQVIEYIEKTAEILSQ